MKKYAIPFSMLAIFEIVALTILDSSVVKICRSKDSGTIFLPVYLKRQLSIMQLQKYLDHCSLGEGGAVMPAGRR